MANGVLGLGSGQAASLSSDLIDKLKTAERKSTVAPFETKIENIATEKTTFSSISTKVSELLAAVKPFDLFVSGGVSAFEQKTASTSGDSVTFDAADIKTLKQGSTTVKVSQLAQKDVYQSKTFDLATKDAKVDLGTLKVNDLPSGEINTKDLTYQQLADKISAEKGMTANIEQVGTNSYRLIIKSEESGIKNKLVISGEASSSLGLDSIDTYQSNAVDATTKNAKINQGTLTINGENFDTTDLTYVGLAAAITAKSGMNATVEPTGTDSYRLNIKSEDNSLLTISGAASSFLGLGTSSNHISTGSNVLKAQNLDATVDGVNYNVASNNITIDGLKITANKLGDSSINVTEDNTQLETQMNNFVTKYNELVALVDTEVQGSDSKLGDKSSIRSIISTIKDKLFGSYGDGKKSVFNYGIELDKYGGLTLDSTKFNSAVQNDKAGLKDLFAGTAEKKGLGTTLKETLDTMTFTGGLLDSYEKGITARETSLNTEKTKAEDILNKKYELMSAQFAAYGTIINQMESSFSGLKMMINQSTSGN